MFKENVVITGECFNLFKDIICDYECRVDNDIEGHTYNATITSANDGVHSNNSTHYKNKAIDLRIKDIDLGRDYLKKYMEAIVMYLAIYIGISCSSYTYTMVRITYIYSMVEII